MNDAQFNQLVKEHQAIAIQAPMTKTSLGLDHEDTFILETPQGRIVSNPPRPNSLEEKRFVQEALIPEIVRMHAAWMYSLCNNTWLVVGEPDEKPPDSIQKDPRRVEALTMNSAAYGKPGEPLVITTFAKINRPMGTKMPMLDAWRSLMELAGPDATDVETVYAFPLTAAQDLKPAPL